MISILFIHSTQVSPFFFHKNSLILKKIHKLPAFVPQTMCFPVLVVTTHPLSPSHYTLRFLPWSKKCRSSFYTIFIHSCLISFVHVIIIFVIFHNSTSRSIQQHDRCDSALVCSAPKQRICTKKYGRVK